MTEDGHDGEHHEGEGETGPEYYDPTSPTPPARQPPLRTTAPQGEFTTGQVGVGFAVLLVGLVIVFGLPLVLA